MSLWLQYNHILHSSNHHFIYFNGDYSKVCTKSIKLIELISEGTFLVMSVHYMMLNTVMKIFPENGWGIIMTALMTLALCTGAIWFCKKYFFALGKINYLNKSSI